MGGGWGGPYLRGRMYIEDNPGESLVEEVGAFPREDEEGEEVGAHDLGLVQHPFHLLLGEVELFH